MTKEEQRISLLLISFFSEGEKRVDLDLTWESTLRVRHESVRQGSVRHEEWERRRRKEERSTYTYGVTINSLVQSRGCLPNEAKNQTSRLSGKQNTSSTHISVDSLPSSFIHFHRHCRLLLTVASLMVLTLSSSYSPPAPLATCSVLSSPRRSFRSSFDHTSPCTSCTKTSNPAAPDSLISTKRCFFFFFFFLILLRTTWCT